MEGEIEMTKLSFFFEVVVLEMNSHPFHLAGMKKLANKFLIGRRTSCICAIDAALCCPAVQRNLSVASRFWSFLTQ